MAYLFTVENNVAIPHTETLLIEPFKTLWNRDKSKDKERAVKEFTFVELMTSKKKTNPYAGYSDDIRFEKLRDMLFDSTWTPDYLIEDCLVKVHEMQKEASPTYSYFIAAMEAAEKMKQFFRSFDINERNDRGLPVYKPKEITSALNDTNNILQNLNTLKDKVEQELFENTKTRANKKINRFEQ